MQRFCALRNQILPSFNCLFSLEDSKAVSSKLDFHRYDVLHQALNISGYHMV
jgi:hypothetical protein